MHDPFLKQQILDSSKLKKFADDNFKFDENDRKFSKKVGKNWEKEKLLVTCSTLPQCFKKTFTANT